jgi:hypothetical protein
VPTSLGARALTVGTHIAFAPGEYRPGGVRGNALIAHELAHVVQQAGGAPAVQNNDGGSESAETAADSAADAVRSGRRIRLSSLCAHGCSAVQLNGDPPQAGAGVEAAPAPFARPEQEQAPQLRHEDMIDFRHQWWSTDEKQLREMFERVMLRGGREGGTEHATWLLREFVSDRGRARGVVPVPVVSAYAVGARRGDLVQNPYTYTQREERIARNEAAIDRLYPAVATKASAVLGRLLAERADVLRRFRSHISGTLEQLLREGQERIDAEILRYGLERTPFTTFAYGHGHVAATPSYRYSIRDEPDVRAMSGAARDLLEQHRAIRRHRTDLLMLDAGTFVRGIFPPNSSQPLGPIIAGGARRAQMVATLQRLEEQYALLGALHSQRYPVLGAFLDDPDELAELASGDQVQQGHTAGELLWQRLERISKTRADLADGDINLWKLDQVIEVAKRTGGIEPGSLYGRWVDERNQEAKDDDKILDYVLSAIGLVLGLLAVPVTGGASLVLAAGSAGLGAVSLSRAVSEYKLKRADSQADRAFAIAGDDPTSFWIALEVVGVVLDLGGAAAALKAIRKPVSEAVSAGAHSADDAMQAAVRAAEAERPGLGARIRRAIVQQRQARGSGRSLAETVAGAAGHEARALRQSGAALTREADQALVSTASRLGGHHIKITPSGLIVRCTTCAIVRAQYAVELSRHPDLAAEWLELQKASRAAAGSANTAEVRKIARKVRDLADRLEILRATAHSRAARDALVRVAQRHADALDSQPIFKARFGEAAKLAPTDPASSARLATELEDDITAIGGRGIRDVIDERAGGLGEGLKSGAAAEEVAAESARGPAVARAVTQGPAETHHLATQFGSRAREIFEEAFGTNQIVTAGRLRHPVHHPVNLLTEFAEHRLFAGWWNATGRYVFFGHHRGYHSWVARHLRAALDTPNLTREQAFRAFVEMTDRLKRVVRNNPHILEYGPEVLPARLQNLAH